MQKAIDALRKDGREYGARGSRAALLVACTLFNAARMVEELMLAGAVDPVGDNAERDSTTREKKTDPHSLALIQDAKEPR